jgi:isopentenyl phosphate kinase
MTDLIFLKLGGSLITDKTVPFTPRTEKIAEIASDIAGAMRTHPELSLVLGHGSGSFGHTAGRKHGTRQGVRTAEEWSGFAEVWYQASELNRHVMSALTSAGIAAVAFAPVASVLARDGKVARWDLEPLRRALDAGILPVVYGDVAFDEVRGGTILSTEDLFDYLARLLNPRWILLAGLEEGVWADFPVRKEIAAKITPESYAGIKQRVGAGLGQDVTGGMESKVELMIELVRSMPGIRAQIFSGEKSGNLTKALEGETVGTLISAM